MRSSAIAIAAAGSALVFAASAQAGSAFVSQNGAPLAAVSATGTTINPYALGTLSNLFSSVFVTLNTAGSFTEYATFTIPTGYAGTNGASNAYALTVALPSGTATVGSITGLGVSIVGGTPAVPGATLGGAFSAGSSFSLASLAAGNYFLKFTGTVVGVGGQYSASVQTSAVPEPTTYAMMLAGVGVVGFLALRRRNDKV